MTPSSGSSTDSTCAPRESDEERRRCTKCCGSATAARIRCARGGNGFAPVVCADSCRKNPLLPLRCSSSICDGHYVAATAIWSMIPLATRLCPDPPWTAGCACPSCLRSLRFCSFFAARGRRVSLSVCSMVFVSSELHYEVLAVPAISWVGRRRVKNDMDRWSRMSTRI